MSEPLRPTPHPTPLMLPPLPPPGIDADITVASTLPSICYGDAAMHAMSIERVFARSWQLIADADDVRVPQTCRPHTLLEGTLDEPIVLVRDGDDRLHCLSNVCTHRGSLVVAETCRTAHLRCPYHGRRFGLDGRFEHMPEFGRARGFPSSSDDLPRIPFASWRRFHFASLKPIAPFAETIAAMERRIGWLPMEEFRHDPSRSRDYLVRANWALYCDNYLEGFHIPFVHAALNAAIDYGAYTTEPHPWSVLQLGIAKPGEERFDLPADSPDAGRDIAAYWWWIFPNLMFNFYPWGLSINIVRPLGPTLTKVSFITYVWREDRLDRGAGAAIDRVEREDESIVELVQRGVKSRLYDRGRYSPDREEGVHHFHRMLVDALNLSG